MLSSFFILALASITSVVLSHPTPLEARVASESQLACYDSCLSDVMCIASYPDGCFCQNNARTSCSSRCDMPSKPELNSCNLDPETEIVARAIPETISTTASIVNRDLSAPVPAPNAPASRSACFSQCLESWSCVAAWPQSCYCVNAVRVRCDNSCSGFGGSSRVVLDVCEE